MFLLDYGYLNATGSAFDQPPTASNLRKTASSKPLFAPLVLWLFCAVQATLNPKP